MSIGGLTKPWPTFFSLADQNAFGSGPKTLTAASWTVQRTPEDMRVLLAAALAAHHPEAAQPALDQLASSRFQYAVVVKLAARVREALARERAALVPAQESGR